jgi:hypothetical protein
VSSGGQVHEVATDDVAFPAHTFRRCALPATFTTVVDFSIQAQRLEVKVNDCLHVLIATGFVR